jgi:hypothetical protein
VRYRKEMNWSSVSPEARRMVIEVLQQEARRREEEARRGASAAEALGRPSLLDEPLAVAAAFQAAIALLQA